MATKFDAQTIVSARVQYLNDKITKLDNDKKQAQDLKLFSDEADFLVTMSRAELLNEKCYLLRTKIPSHKISNDILNELTANPLFKKIAHLQANKIIVKISPESALTENSCGLFCAGGCVLSCTTCALCSTKACDVIVFETANIK